MKIALITDTQLGIRNDNIHVLNNSKKFLEDIFIPYLEENNIREVVHLGDLVDRRKFINFYTASVCRWFIEELLKRGIVLRLLLGNHDIFYRNETWISVCSELYCHYDHLPHKFSGKFHYYDKPAEITYDGTPILFVPWICNTNREQTTKAIEKSTAKVLFGHLELLGFDVQRGVPAHKGEDPEIYAKFNVVCTGHYHHKSSRGNIHILGSAGQYVWSDYGDMRGFHIFDTRDLSLDFIQNPYGLFEKVFYDDSEEDKIKQTKFETLKHKYVKVIVNNNNNIELYDWFLNKIEEAQTIEYTIVQDHLNLDQIDDENIISETKTTLEIIRDCIALANTTLDSNKLDRLLVKLYNEAQTLE